MPEKLSDLALNEQAKQALKFLNYKPTQQECENYSQSHTRTYKNMSFYLFKMYNSGKIVSYTFSSGNMHNGNILKLFTNLLDNGNFISLEKITIKEYANNGGGDIPCCLLKCNYEGEFPQCIKTDSK